MGKKRKAWELPPAPPPADLGAPLPAYAPNGEPYPKALAQNGYLLTRDLFRPDGWAVANPQGVALAEAHRSPGRRRAPIIAGLARLAYGGALVLAVLAAVEVIPHSAFLGFTAGALVFGIGVWLSGLLLRYARNRVSLDVRALETEGLLLRVAADSATAQSSVHLVTTANGTVLGQVEEPWDAWPLRRWTVTSRSGVSFRLTERSTTKRLLSAIFWPFWRVPPRLEMQRVPPAAKPVGSLDLGEELLGGRLLRVDGDEQGLVDRRLALAAALLALATEH